MATLPGSTLAARSAQLLRVISPYKNPRPRPRVAWMLDATTCLTEELDVVSIEHCDAYVWGDFELVMDLLAKGTGEALCWDNRPIRWSPMVGVPSWPVRVLQVSIPKKPEECVEGLMTWRDWLCSYGAAPAGSLGGSGMSLLKATLDAPLWTRIGEPPPIRFTIGGRQELGPRGAPLVINAPLKQWDIQAAYASTLGHLNYGGYWKAVDSRYPFRFDANNETMMFVRAKVRIPEQPWAPLLGPLPERPRKERDYLMSQLQPVSYPTGCEMQGTWTWQELAQAESAGCTILRVLEGWVHCATIEQKPFLPWWHAVEQGRLLGGFAGMLAKASGNATWGQFAIRRGRRSVVRVVHNGTPKRVVRALPLKGGGNPSQRAPDLAEFVSALVRAELHRGMMEAERSLVSAHTDGLWMVDDGSITGWRPKEEATTMRLVNPQNLSYVRPDESDVRYVVAGVRSRAAGPFFEEQWSDLERKHGGRPHALRPADREGSGIPRVVGC